VQWPRRLAAGGPERQLCPPQKNLKKTTTPTHAHHRPTAPQPIDTAPEYHPLSRSPDLYAWRVHPDSCVGRGHTRALLYRLWRPLRQSLACADTVTVDFGNVRSVFSDTHHQNFGHEIGSGCRVEGADPSPSQTPSPCEGLSANVPVKGFLRKDSRDAGFAPSRAKFNLALGAQALTRAPTSPSTPHGRRRTPGGHSRGTASSMGAPSPGRALVSCARPFFVRPLTKPFWTKQLP
jgi:hypothetical protein